ncbi:MAG TPA: PAS domain S-box protein [Geobacteraceae bacterium]
MGDEAKRPSTQAYRVVIMGVLLVALFWVVDSLIDNHFEQTSVVEELFHPDVHEIAIRLLAIFVQIIFIGYILTILRKRLLLERKLADAVVVAESERKRSEAIVAAMGDAVSIQDTEFRVLYQNEAHKQLMGEHAGEFCYAAYRRKDSICAGCHLALAFRDGEVHRAEVSNVLADGRTIHVEIIGSPLKDPSGKIIAGIETVRDITERKAMENRLKTQMSAIENSMDGIAILNDRQEYTYVNQAHAAAYGYDSQAELLGKSWRELYREEDVAWFERAVLPILLDKGRWHGESVGKRRDGSVFSQELSLNSLEDGGLICVVRDISARKESEERIREQTAFLQRLIDTIPNAIFYKDAAGRYLGCNAAYARIVGLACEEVIGKTVLDITPHVLARIHHDLDQELLEAGGVQTYESFMRHGDGSMHDVIFNKAAFTDSEGRVAGLVGVILDITEHKQAEEEIRRLNVELTERARQLVLTNRDLEAFNYSLSHDLRVPLTRIYTAAQALEEQAGQLNDEGRFMLQNVLDGTEAMEQLIEAMLILGRVSRSELQRQEVDLSELARTVGAETQLANAGHLVEFVVAPGVWAEGDPQLLRVVFENFLGNAWKYTRNTPQPRVEFGVEGRRGERVYFIRDNGAGFDMEKADRLFKPFQRLHAASEYPGYGIGLATVQRVIERHGGQVWGEGTVGAGATFFFTLSAVAAAGRPGEKQVALGGEKVV